MTQASIISDSLASTAFAPADTLLADTLQAQASDLFDAMDGGQTEIQHFISLPGKPPASFNPQALNRQQEGFLLIPLAAAFLFIAIARVLGNNIFMHMRKALASRPIFRQLLRDGLLLPKITKLPLLLAYLFILSVFILRLDAAFLFLPPSPDHAIYRQLFSVFGLLALFELGRYFLTQWLGILFKAWNFTYEFNSNTILYNAVSSILLLPFLLLSVYSPASVLVYIAVAVFVIFFVLRLFRAFFIIFELRSYSGFQIFVYICTLEILPVFVFVKILTGEHTVV